MSSPERAFLRRHSIERVLIAQKLVAFAAILGNYRQRWGYPVVRSENSMPHRDRSGLNRIRPSHRSSAGEATNSSLNDSLPLFESVMGKARAEGWNQSLGPRLARKTEVASG